MLMCPPGRRVGPSLSSRSWTVTRRRGHSVGTCGCPTATDWNEERCMMENRYSTVPSAIDLRLCPSLPTPSVYLDAHKSWLERGLGYDLAQTVVLRLPGPYRDFILEEFLKRTPLSYSV